MWSSDGTQLAGACANKQVLVGHLIERYSNSFYLFIVDTVAILMLGISWHRLPCIQSSQTTTTLLLSQPFHLQNTKLKHENPNIILHWIKYDYMLYSHTMFECITKLNINTSKGNGLWLDCTLLSERYWRRNSSCVPSKHKRRWQ